MINSSTDLLKRPDLADIRRQRYVAAISDTVDRAAKLTGQLLAFARRQTLKPEVFDVCDSVRAFSDMVGTLTGAPVAIVTELLTWGCFVDADPSQFDTALVNTVGNARDAMSGEGRLTIHVDAVQRMPSVRQHAEELRFERLAPQLQCRGAFKPARQQRAHPSHADGFNDVP